MVRLDQNDVFDFVSVLYFIKMAKCLENEYKIELKKEWMKSRAHLLWRLQNDFPVVEEFER